MMPAEVVHPSIFILEECDARGWTRDDLALAMGPREDFGVNRLSIDLYCAVHDRSCRMGGMVPLLAHAFGVSEEYFQNLETAWLEHPDSATPSNPSHLRVVAKISPTLPPLHQRNKGGLSQKNGREK